MDAFGIVVLIVLAVAFLAVLSWLMQDDDLQPEPEDAMADMRIDWRERNSE